jgi:hypothetical protein
VNAPSTAKAYGSYEDLVQDPNVDIIYVATPHSHHYQNARLCLEAGKHTLCEKAFTVNAAQAEILVQIAREKKVFLMEAVWTRYFPVAKAVREFVKSGKLGEVRRVWADTSFWKDVEKEFGTEHRMVKLDLAGGALLDCELIHSWEPRQFIHIYNVKVLFEEESKADRSRSGNILPNMDLPNSLPHRPRKPARPTHRSLLSNKIRPHRRRRANNHDPNLPQPRRPRHRHDQPPRRFESKRRPSFLRPDTHPRHTRRDNCEQHFQTYILHDHPGTECVEG